tara:strand:+ start:325 stop:675 length:351 start_codon:yes stop_codon:yes gene_type:complete
VEEIPHVSNDIDSMIILADEAILNLTNKKKKTERAQRKLNRKIVDAVRLRNHYKDSVDDLRSLRLINRDSVVYNYKIELVSIVDTVRVNVSDSICSVCIYKAEKKKRRFKLFKKKK